MKRLSSSLKGNKYLKSLRNTTHSLGVLEDQENAATELFNSSAETLEKYKTEPT